MSMRVTRGQIVLRGLAHRCPNCGSKSLFKPGALFELNPACSSCGLPTERDEGQFLAAMSLNYGVTLIFFLSPISLFWYFGSLSGETAVILAGGCAVFVPMLLYRSSRSWGLSNYYFFFPQHLPANRSGPPSGSGDHND